MSSYGQRFDTTEIDVSKHSKRVERKRRKRRKRRESRVPRWVYRIIVILILSVVGMLLWLNRSNLTPSNIVDWVQMQVVGMGIGDGFPVKITGTIVSPGNFRSSNKDLVMVGDTGLAVFNSSAKQTVSRQHSFSNPVMKVNGTRALIYNLGGKGYQLESVSKTLVKTNSEQNILAGALASNGSFALITEEDGYCGCLTVYDVGGQALYHYWFSDYYPTAVALNHNATKAAVTAISAKDGALVSAVYLLDLSSSQTVEPFASYMENAMLDVSFSENGTVVAVGDKMTAVINTLTKTKTNFDYQGLQLSAYYTDAGRIVLSLSPYKNSGSSRLIVLDKTGKTVVSVNTTENIKSVSLFGETAAALQGSTVNFYSLTDQSLQGSCNAGADAKAITLQDESSVYILGISEVRYGKCGKAS
jgi:hypothetical protein